MEISLLLFLKKDIPNANLKTRTKNMLKTVFGDSFSNDKLKLDSSLWNANDGVVILGCTVGSRSSNSSIILSVNDCKKKSILAIEYATQKIIKGEHRKDFYITKSYDEISQYLAEPLYKQLTLFERKLRRLIYEIVIKSFGGKWFEQTFYLKTDLVNKLSESSHKNIVKEFENVLEDMTYNDLTAYLFTKVPSKELESMLNDELSPDRISNYSKDDLARAIEQLRPYSLWDRLFTNNMELSGLQEEINSIRDIRNKVMHAKTISYIESSNSKKTLKTWISKLDNEYEYIKNHEYTSSDIWQIMNSFTAIAEAFKDALEPSLETITNIQTGMLSVIADTLKSIASIDYTWIDSLKNISNDINNMISNFNIGLPDQSDIDDSSSLDSKEEKTNEKDNDNENNGDSDNADDNDINDDPPEGK